MSFENFLAAVKAPALRDIILYWREIRGTERMPGWRAIDPAAIARHLGIVWAWKYDRGADRFVGRLAGEEIVAAFGKSPRGMPIEEFLPKDQHDMIIARHRRVVTEPALAHAVGRVFVDADRFGTCEHVALPLAADGIKGDGILGASLFQGPLGERSATPIRLDPDNESVAYFSLR